MVTWLLLDPLVLPVYSYDFVSSFLILIFYSRTFIDYQAIFVEAFFCFLFAPDKRLSNCRAVQHRFPSAKVLSILTSKLAQLAPSSWTIWPAIHIFFTFKMKQIQTKAVLIYFCVFANILRRYSIGKHGHHELSLKNVADNWHAGQIKGTLQQVCGREEDARNLAGADATRPSFLTVCCKKWK